MNEELFESERMVFRTWSDEDLTAFATINANREVMRFFPGAMTTDDTRAILTLLQRHQLDHGFCFWAVELKSDKQLIGMIGLNRPRFDAAFTPCVEIGWRLHPSVWRMGLAAEGARACLDYAWKELGLQEVVSFTASINLPSQGVMKKIGMHPDGSFDHPALPAGHPLQRHVLYRISRPALAGKDLE